MFKRVMFTVAMVFVTALAFTDPAASGSEADLKYLQY
ncbi:hypothetical protein Misp06_00217 [Microbulbifer sp. NBRC 101763]